MSSYIVELRGWVFADSQPNDADEPKLIMAKLISLPFAPTVGLTIDLGDSEGVSIDDVIWCCERECFACKVTLGWDATCNEVESESEMKAKGWRVWDE
jgi:hypothetical protein